MIEQLAELDDCLAAYASQIGSDYQAYRHHCYRVLNLTLLRYPQIGPDEMRDLAVAVACHDVGIWTDHTLDYLEPSVRQALSLPDTPGAPLDRGRITDLIVWHHKVTPFRGAFAALVNAFRRADWYDVMLGLTGHLSPDVRKRAIYRCFPVAGFHIVLLRLIWRRLRSHPLSPLPMFRW
ncbi:MAG: hypothetical protein PHP86_03610 [Nevskiales bacterium]|nr:hypothetical protein [Nevskiales bacterium]